MGVLGDFMSFLRDPMGKREGRDEMAAQAAAYENLNAALSQWQEYEQGLDQMQAPWNQGATNAAITRERDVIGAGAANEIEQARRLAGASGLGGGGGLQMRERLIREEMARRNAATVRDVTQTATRENSAWQAMMANLRGQATAGQTSLLSASPVGLTGQPPPNPYAPRPPAGMKAPITPEPTVWGGRG